MVIRVRCSRAFDNGVFPDLPDRVVIEVGWDRWLLDITGRCYSNPADEKARNAGLTSDR